MAIAAAWACIVCISCLGTLREPNRLFCSVVVSSSSSCQLNYEVVEREIVSILLYTRMHTQ